MSELVLLHVVTCRQRLFKATQQGCGPVLLSANSHGS